MLAEGTPLALVKELINNLVIPPPPTPAEQYELDATYQKGLSKFVTSRSHLR